MQISATQISYSTHFQIFACKSSEDLCIAKIVQHSFFFRIIVIFPINQPCKGYSLEFEVYYRQGHPIDNQ